MTTKVIRFIISSPFFS